MLHSVSSSTGIYNSTTTAANSIGFPGKPLHCIQKMDCIHFKIAMDPIGTQMISMVAIGMCFECEENYYFTTSILMAEHKNLI